MTQGILLRDWAGAEGTELRDTRGALSCHLEGELKPGLGANSALGVEKPGCKGVGRSVNPPHGPKSKG